MPNTIDDPLMLLTFDEGTGTTAADSSGHGNNGTLTNGTKWTSSAKIGSHAFSDAVGFDAVSVGTPASLEVDLVTLAAWVKFATIDRYQFCIARDNGSTLRHYAIGVDSLNRVYGYAANSGGTFVDCTAVATVTTGVWYHLALTFDGTHILIYLNGVQVGTASLSGTLKKGTAQPIVVAGLTTGSSRITGDEDDARIYGRALNATEIGMLYSYPNPVNTVAPALSGTSKVGNTLTTSDGTWDSGTTTAYRWQTATDSGGTGAADIAGQTTNTLALIETYAAKYVRSGVTRNAGGDTEAFSAWQVVKCDKGIRPDTGSDSNTGQASSQWATLEHAQVFIKAHVGAVENLYIDTSTAPLYVTTTNPQFNDSSGIGLTITSATADYADVRFWELISGSTAVPYDTYYSTSGHPNIYVLVTRQDACIWEFMGGRGDNLKWFDHLINCGISPSATYNNSTNLSTLNSTPWSWWTGTDGVNYVTLFNPNGTPVGRNFAVPYQPGQNTGGSCMEMAYGTVSNLCLGGFSGCTPTGTALAGTALQGSQGATIDGNILYGGCTHLGLSGDGNSVTWQNNIYREGPRWCGPGGYSVHVWFSEGTSQQPTFTNETCTYGVSVAGSVRGSNFYDSTTIGIDNQICGAFIGHGAAITAWAAGLGVTTSQVVMTNCYFGGIIGLPIAATNCTFGTIGTSGSVQSCTLLNCPAVHTQNESPLAISDSLIYLNLAGTDGSHYPFLRSALTLQNCTVIEEDYLAGIAGVRPIFDAELGVSELTVNDCILSLATACLTNGMNLDGTDTLDANRNIYIGLSSVLHANLASGGVNSNRTFAQTQALGFETGSVLDADGSGTKLRADFTIPPSSIAVAKATVRVDAPDRTGVVFASRSATGAYEPSADRPSFRPPSRTTFDRAKVVAELFVDEYDKRQSRGQGTFKQTSGSTASYNIGQTLKYSAGDYLPADGAACDAILIQNLVDVASGTEVENVALLLSGPVVIEQDALEFADSADQDAQIAALLARRIRCVRAPANSTRAGE